MSSFSGFVLAWISLFVVLAIRSAARGRMQSALVFIGIFFLYYGVPLVLDIAVGPVPEGTFRVFRGFGMSSADPASNRAYLIFIAICPAIVWALGRPTVAPMPTRSMHTGGDAPKWLQRVLLVLVVAPFVALLGTPDWDLSLAYGAITDPGLRSEEFSQFHATLSLLLVVSLVAQAVLIVTMRRPSFLKVAVLIALALACVYLQGKRNGVAIWLFSLWCAFFLRGWLRRQGVVWALALFIVLAGFSIWYQERRHLSAGARSFEEKYGEYRIEYGRDEHMKLAIYSLLNPERLKIVDYPGQSLLFSAMFFVPRAIFAGKPYPYHVYLTPAAIGYSGSNILAWGVTSSLLDEIVANCGWIGFLLGPLVFAWLCRLGDRSSRMTRLSTAGVIVLLMSVELAAFTPVLLIWLSLVAADRRLLSSGRFAWGPGRI